MKTKLAISIMLFCLAIWIMAKLVLTYEPILVMLGVIIGYILGFIGLIFLVLFLRECLNNKGEI